MFHANGVIVSRPSAPAHGVVGIGDLRFGEARQRAALGAADRAFAARVIASCQTATRPATARPATAEGLSERELEVLRLVASGASNQDAARKLFIAASTVKKYLENIYAKLAVGGRVEAIARAREMKLL